MGERRLSRRQLLSAGAAGAGGLLLYLGRRGTQDVQHSGHSNLEVAQAGGLAARMSSPSVAKFSVALPRPAVLQPISQSSAAASYTIDVQQSRQEILPGLMTSLYTYNGTFPGMTIEARRGQKTILQVTNRIAEPVSAHNHGGVTAPQHDGYAEDIILNGTRLPTLIQPGGSWTYEYPNEQAACTNWLHDHAIHKTAEHVYRGMACLYLIRDEEEAGFNLPQGDYEIPLVFQDRLFDSGGELVYNNNGHDGVEGDVQLVNGAPWPRLKVAARKYRFRLLNGSNWRRYRFLFSNRMNWIQIGTEAGFLRRPATLSSLTLYPGERSDVIIDFSKVPVGTTIYLQNRAKEAEGTAMGRVMAFEVTHHESDDSQVPDRLTQYEDLTTSAAVGSAVNTRVFEFGRTNGKYAINGKFWNPKRFDADPRLGTTEIWHLKNPSGGWFHPIHIHLINFQILERKIKLQWRRPNAWELGRKDVVALPENEEVKVIIKFDPQEYLNFTGPYMIHCHNVDHEDHDMMTQYKLLPSAV